MIYMTGDCSLRSSNRLAGRGGLTRALLEQTGECEECGGAGEEGGEVERQGGEEGGEADSGIFTASHSKETVR